MGRLIAGRNFLASAHHGSALGYGSLSTHYSMVMGAEKRADKQHLHKTELVFAWID